MVKKNLTSLAPLLIGFLKKKILITQSKNKIKSNKIKTNMAQEMLKQLFTGQLEGIARKIASQTGQDVDECINIAQGHISEMDLSVIAQSATKTGKKSSRKSKGPVPEKCRCKARIWGSGSGNDQCQLRALDGKVYCKRHQKQADDVVQGENGTIGGETPCCFFPWSEDNKCKDVKGKKRGLFMGRIDHPLEKAIVDSNGVIRIEWNNPKIQSLVDEKVRTGEWRYSKGRGNRKPKGTNKPKGTKKPKGTNKPKGTKKTKKPNVLEKQSIEVQGKSQEDKEVQEEVQDIDVEENTLSLENAFDDIVDGSDSESDEEEIDAEEMEYGGQTYYVNTDDGSIYDIDDGTVIGKWDFENEKPILD